MHSDEQLRSKTERQLDEIQSQLVACRPDELQPHPSYDRHNLAPSASQLTAIAALGDSPFREPILVTRDRTIVDGHARWKVALLAKRPKLLCMEYQLDKVEALRMLLRTHRRLRGFTPFERISLALDLKPFFQEKAKSNQRMGGRKEGLSNLTTVHVRNQIAIEAGVSCGNVTKFEQLMETAHPKVRQAAQTGEISLHKAWKWRTLSPEEQLSALHFDQAKRGTKRVVSQLIRRLARKRSPASPTRRKLGDLLQGFSIPRSQRLDSVEVIVINAPGNIAFLTPEAIQALRKLEG